MGEEHEHLLKRDAARVLVCEQHGLVVKNVVRALARLDLDPVAALPAILVDLDLKDARELVEEGGDALSGQDAVALVVLPHALVRAHLLSVDRLDAPVELDDVAKVVDDGTEDQVGHQVHREDVPNDKERERPRRRAAV